MNKRHVWMQRFLLRLDASGRFNFLVHRRTRTLTYVDERRHMQNSSAAFYVQAVICLGLESLSPLIPLSHVGSFSRSRNTAGTQSIVSKTPPTNLQRSELAYPLENLLDSWICFIERSWLYDGLYLVSIACIWQTQTNARQTASGVWADAASRHVQTLDGLFKDFLDVL